MEALSLPVLLSLSLVLHLVLAELHCDLHICMVQILQRLSSTSPLLSVLLWSPPLAFPLENIGPQNRVSFAWGNCQPPTSSLSSDISLGTLLPLKCFLTPLSKLVKAHVPFLVPSLYFSYCNHHV